MTWYEAVRLLAGAVFDGNSGQAGTITVAPPDARIPVRFSATKGSLIVTVAGEQQTYDDASAAVSAYAAAVEGYA